MRRRPHLTPWLVGMLAALLCSALHAAADGPQRLALVVGNARLASQRVLDSAPRDVQAVSAALRAAGFLVMVREDIGADALRGTLDEFRARLRPDGIGVIYLATLGAQVEGQSLLLMRDTPLPGVEGATPATVAAALQRDAVELVEVLQALAGNKEPMGPRALVVDAAWQHPLLDRLPQRGLAEPRPPAGVVLLLSAPPGQALPPPAVGASPSPGSTAPRDFAATAFARQLATRFVIPGVAVAETLRAVRQDIVDAAPGRAAPWLAGDTDAALPMVEPASALRAPLDGRTQAAGEGGERGARGERPVFVGRRNSFGHAEGDVFAFRRSDAATQQELGVETLFIETLASDGTLVANGGELVLDGQGRPVRQRGSDGSTTRYAPAQELWWAAPAPGQRRKVAFTESIERSDGSRATAEWLGTVEVGEARTLSLPAGEIEALPLKSAGTVSIVGAAGTAPVLRRRFARTVWVSPLLAYPVAIDIEDSDAQGQPLPRERLELLRAQTSSDGR